MAPRTIMVDYGGVRFEGDDGGLFGPAEIEHFLRTEHERARRYKYPVVCTVLSIDRLDQLQDLYGYEARETIVKSVVRVVRSAMRDSDLLGRLTGDRLLVLWSHTSKETGALLAKRLLAAVKRQSFDLDGRMLKVTASVGVSHNGAEDAHSFDTLVAVAEEGLLVAQKAGGDRHVETELYRLHEARRRGFEGVPAPIPAAHAIPVEAPRARPSLSDELIERDLKIELLERRVAKLMAMLDVSEEELRRVRSARQVDVGVPSIYREVQGLSSDEAQQERKREMMRSIFEANLALRAKAKDGGAVEGAGS
jgi:diguanylate cyclase (GGDEF)-like protein